MKTNSEEMEKKNKEKFLKQEAESFPESKLETKMKDFPGPDRLKIYLQSFECPQSSLKWSGPH